MQELRLKDFIVDACKADAALEFLPQKKMELDLRKIAEKLAKFAQIQAETPHVLIFTFKGVNVSLFKSGRILVKEADEEKARSIVAELLRTINA